MDGSDFILAGGLIIVGIIVYLYMNKGAANGSDVKLAGGLYNSLSTTGLPMVGPANTTGLPMVGPANTTGLPMVGPAINRFAALTSDYPDGPYHFGPTCDADRIAVKDSGMNQQVTKKACKLIGGVYDAKYNGVDERDIPYGDNIEVGCYNLRVCRNKPTDEDIFIGKYQPANPLMLGTFDKDNVLFPNALCDQFGGVLRSGRAYAANQCKLGLYKKKDLPDGAFLMPGSIGKTIPGLRKVVYSQSYSLPMGDCRKMGGAWNGGTEGKTDTTQVDCHLDWYTNAL